MARKLHWRELRTGLIAFGVLATIVIGILFFARVGQLHGDTSTLYVLTDDATGVLPGTEVWLSGEKVGLVKRIRFRSVRTDTTRRVEIETMILTHRMHLVRRDAYANIEPGGSLVGAPIVFISSGTSMAPALKPGDSLVDIPTSAIKPLGERVTLLLSRLNLLVDTSKKLVTMMSSTKGSLGAFKQSGVPQIANASGAVSGLVNKANYGDGTIGLAKRGDLGARFGRILAAKDSITLLLTSGKGNVGRFRNDSTLGPAITGIRAEIDSLKALMATPGGIARVRSDTTLKTELARVSAELAALMADVKKNRGRYLRF